jgi:hypothetical protein
MGLSDYVRAEFLRNRQLDYVKAARALGVGNWHIIWRHILPNSLTPVVTFLPFRMSAAILALTSLDFLGLGVPPGTPSLGELLSQGKNNIDAWWISLSTFAVLVVTLAAADLHGRCAARCARPTKGRQVMQAHAQPPPPLCCRCATCRFALAPSRWCVAWASRLRGAKSWRWWANRARARPSPRSACCAWLGDAVVEGQACLPGATCWQLSEREMRGVRGGDIAMVFQEPMTALNPLMTIGQQISRGFELKKA